MGPFSGIFHSCLSWVDDLLPKTFLLHVSRRDVGLSYFVIKVPSMTLFDSLPCFFRSATLALREVILGSWESGYVWTEHTSTTSSLPGWVAASTHRVDWSQKYNQMGGAFWHCQRLPPVLFFHWWNWNWKVLPVRWAGLTANSQSATAANHRSACALPPMK